MKGFLRFENYSALFDDQDLLIQFIDQAVKEDVGAGDLTTTSVIPNAQEAQAFFLVKEDCVLAGVELSKLIFSRIDEGLSFHSVSHDGAFVKAGTVIGRVSGNIQSLLKAERLVLNAMQRMSAIATKTNALVEKASSYGVTILDTRKTTPNFRICEKWAVAIGGGKNNRYALYDQILIKDNHIKYVGGIKNALDNLSHYLEANKLVVPVIVEVQNEEEFGIAIQYEVVDRILMDNFQPAEIKSIITKYQFTQQLEASGGIDADNMDAYLESGIQYLSVGDLTHHIQSIDISLKIE
jgi:nicotinate-nucleotide pyrophosphorylase (carboxylating)